MSLLDTMQQGGGIPALVACMLQPDAHHEGRAQWRPVAKFGRDIACAWDHLEPNRKKALDYARVKTEELMEAGFKAFGKEAAE